MEKKDCIRRAQSRAADARDAAAEFHAAVQQKHMALVVFFCSSEYDLDVLAGEMRRLFAGVQVVGCTTAGEIGPTGYIQHSLTGASFSDGSFRAVSGRIDRLDQFETARGRAFAQNLLQRLERIEPRADADNSFALLLIDGLSVREESVTRSLQHALGKLPLIGGSVSDGLKFSSTHVYFDGRFCANSAILILATTQLPFKLFKTQHFVATEERLVVTEADTALRVVKEIDGRPAAQAYARILGIDEHDLNQAHFASSPIVVVVDGVSYVRSIQKANPDGSLTLFCAIEDGVVLRVAKGMDLLTNLERAFTQVRAAVGQPQIVIAFDCVLRRLEISQNGSLDRLGDLLRQNNTIGFSTYGEQFRGVHVNQTLVGIAIGPEPEDTDAV
jgi:hypothetical protein